VLTGDVEEIHTTALNLFDKPHSRRYARHDARESALALMERQASHIFAIQPEQIERHEVRPLATEHQVVEVTPAVRLKTNDLAVEDRLVAANSVRELRREVRPGPVFSAAPRNELALMSVDVGERAKAVPLHFVHPVWMVEGLSRDRERHWRKEGKHSTSAYSSGELGI
jgi:hypothetical protein